MRGFAVLDAHNAYTAGLILGMKSAGWDDVPLVTMETVGADCWNKSLKEGRIVKIDAIRR